MQPQGVCTVPIPPELLDPLRDGLRSRIAVAAQLIVSADAQREARACVDHYQEALRSMDALRTLLEEIGWNAPPGDPRVDLQIHHWALIEALRDQVDTHVDMFRDIPQEDERRAAMTSVMTELTSLALSVLLEAQAQILYARRDRARYSGKGCAALCNALPIRKCKSLK
jgi:hypothetical protein